MENKYLTFALGKGRLAKKTLELFESIGITYQYQFKCPHPMLSDSKIRQNGWRNYVKKTSNFDP